jgi:serine/threonine-protein phosphatase 2A regulatory subunit B'
MAQKEPKILYLVQDAKTQKNDRAKVEDKWKLLTKQASLKNPNFKEPGSIILEILLICLVPYVDSHIVGEHNGLNNGNIWIQ